MAVLEATFPAGGRLLEIGCGTGEEALHLARAGYKLLATDISPAMAAQTAAKARAAGLDSQISTLAIPGGDLGSLQPKQPFDGAFASFGSLNCEPNLDHLVAALAAVLRPGAAFVCSVMARWCPVEIGWHLIHLNPQQAFRRLHHGWQSVALNGGDGKRLKVKVRYFSVGEIEGAFSESFALERVRALPLLLPPPYLEATYKKYRSFFDRLEPWEVRLRDRWPWRGFGDHIIMVFRRR